MKTASHAQALPNELLGALPARDYAPLAKQLERFDLRAGEVLYEPGQLQNWVYFPAGAVISKLYMMEGGGTGAIALVGIEGAVGFSLYMGGRRAPTEAMVQCAGPAYRIKGDLLRQEFDTDGTLRQLMLRYTESLLIQFGQTAVCNRHHSVDQQLCRWLLMILDRQRSNEIMMTQELLARMLGVRREGVSEAAGKLREAGIIHYSRGRITVLDRPRLEALACECYEAVRIELARLMPWCGCRGCQPVRPVDPIAKPAWTASGHPAIMTEGAQHRG
jgi:CRP-like cAMP-binding protein